MLSFIRGWWCERGGKGALGFWEAGGWRGRGSCVYLDVDTCCVVVSWI